MPHAADMRASASTQKESHRQPVRGAQIVRGNIALAKVLTLLSVMKPFAF
jgi:hypothetical protein